MNLQYGELRPTNGWDRFVSLGHHSKFQQVSRLGIVTAQPNCGVEQMMYSAGRPSRWALAHISSSLINLLLSVVQTIAAMLITSEHGSRTLWLSVCVRTMNIEINDLWPPHLACWFILRLPRIISKVKVTGQSLRRKTGAGQLLVRPTLVEKQTWIGSHK